MLDHGLDLEQLARDAIARGADCLGMAGGDGSQALVASIAVECGVPFVCVSAGTRNHFAQDLGIDRDDPRKSVYAFRDAVERRIDYATVNERFFVNNVSLGVYATIVQQDSYRDAKVETTKAMLPELLGAPKRRSISSSPPRTAPRSTAPSSSRSRTTRTRSTRRSTPGNDAASTPASSASSRSPEPPARTPRRSSPSTPSVDETAAGTGTSSPPRPSRCARDRGRPLPASTARRSTWRPRWCSASIPAAFVSWCPKETSKRRSSAAPATSASASCSMSHRDEHEVDVSELAHVAGRRTPVSSAFMPVDAGRMPTSWGGHSEEASSIRRSRSAGHAARRPATVRPRRAIRDGCRPTIGPIRSPCWRSRTPPVSPTWCRCVMGA